MRASNGRSEALQKRGLSLFASSVPVCFAPRLVVAFCLSCIFAFEIHNVSSADADPYSERRRQLALILRDVPVAYFTGGVSFEVLEAVDRNIEPSSPIFWTIANCVKLFGERHDLPLVEMPNSQIVQIYVTSGSRGVDIMPVLSELRTRELKMQSSQENLTRHEANKYYGHFAANSVVLFSEDGAIKYLRILFFGGADYFIKTFRCDHDFLYSFAGVNDHFDSVTISPSLALLAQTHSVEVIRGLVEEVRSFVSLNRNVSKRTLITRLTEIFSR